MFFKTVKNGKWNSELPQKQIDRNSNIISIFNKKFDFNQKFRFLTKISIFDENFDFQPKMFPQNQNSRNSNIISDQNFDCEKDFWPKKRFKGKTLIRKFKLFKKMLPRADFFSVFFFWIFTLNFLCKFCV